MITFRVDDVVPATNPPETKTISGALATSLGNQPILDIGDIHPLLGAVHVAFAEHRPLVISPDAVWITIAQGVAQHVRLNAEELRGRFVRHEGRREIVVAGLAMDASIIRGFREAIAKEVGQGIARLFVCDFTTTTDADITASEIVMLDTFAPYYQLVFACICGIPEITLMGTAEDWKKIRARLDVIGELGLEFWTRSLAPLADEWVRTAEGKPNSEFWKAIYKPEQAYGWDRILGWIARMYPYLKESGQYRRRNKLLEFPLGQEPKPEGMFHTTGISTNEVMSGFSQVPITVRTESESSRTILVRGGLAGVVVGPHGLEPRAGWDIVEDADTTRHVIERIEREHSLERSTGAQDVKYATKELHRFWVLCKRARIFGWSVRAADEIELIDIDPDVFIVRVVDLDDGTFLGFVCNVEDEPWVRMQSSALKIEHQEGVDDVTGLSYARDVVVTTERFENIPVVETTFVGLLLRALDGDGKPTFATVHSLKDALTKPCSGYRRMR